MNAAAFTAADMKAVTGAGAPSYTSGVHIWKGTAEILKPKPMMRNTAPSVMKSGDAAPLDTLCPIAAMFVLPVAP